MSNWQNYLNEDQPKHRKRKIDKNKFCRKNKLGPDKFGPHNYIDYECEHCNKPMPKNMRDK